MITSFRILIDSSNPLMVQQLQHCLSTYSQEIVCTHNQSGHLDTLPPGPFDVAFIDLKNPHFNTAPLIEQIKTHKRCHLVAIITRGTGLPSAVNHHPFDDTLTTPILTSALKKIIFQITASQQKHSAPTLPADFLSPLLTKTQQNKQLAQTLLERCFEDFPKQWSEIKTHVTQQNIQQLQDSAHKLNGAAAFCGLTAIQQAADNLETLAKNHALKQLGSALESLEKTLQLFFDQYDELINQLTD